MPRLADPTLAALALPAALLFAPPGAFPAAAQEAPLLSCQERCLEDWPLVTVAGDTVPISDAVSRFLVDTIDWKGENVVVYASNALFYYFRDEPGGEPLGQEVHTWGGWWYLVRPDGELIETGIAPETDG